MKIFSVLSKSTLSFLTGLRVAVVVSWIWRKHSFLPAQDKPYRSLFVSSSSPNAYFSFSGLILPSENIWGERALSNSISSACVLYDFPSSF
jgi:hypothetical protein